MRCPTIVDDLSPFPRCCSLASPPLTTNQIYTFRYSSHTRFDRVLVTCTFSFHLSWLKCVVIGREIRLVYLSSGIIEVFFSLIFFPLGVKSLLESAVGCCERMTIYIVLNCARPLHVYTPTHRHILRCLLFTFSPSLVVLLFTKYVVCLLLSISWLFLTPPQSPIPHGMSYDVCSPSKWIWINTVVTTIPFVFSWTVLVDMIATSHLQFERVNRFNSEPCCYGTSNKITWGLI